MKFKVHEKMVKVFEKYKEAIHKKYGFICLQSMYYNQPNLVLYDVEKNVKEIWENKDDFDVVSFIECITIQVKIMESMKMTFYAISMEDIYLLHYEKPIYVIMSNDIATLEDDFFTFTIPDFSHDKDEYLFYPELMRLKKIPATFHKSVVYYSIGLIVFSFLFGCPVWKEEYYLEDIPIIDYIEKIKGSKLYFFLKRCFASELLFV
jgi:hypothetical protein